MDFSDDNYCFACGGDNPYGLQLQFTREGEFYYTDFRAERRFQGYNGILHGGITSTILDEVMARHLTTRGIGIFTATMEIRYKKPIPTGVTVRFTAWQKEQRRNIYIMEAQAVLPGGEIAALATAKFMRVGTISPEPEEGAKDENNR